MSDEYRRSLDDCLIEGGEAHDDALPCQPPADYATNSPEWNSWRTGWLQQHDAYRSVRNAWKRKCAEQEGGDDVGSS